jgi:hypothetical protein
MNASSQGQHGRRPVVGRVLILPALVAASWGCGARTSFEWLEDSGEPRECAAAAESTAARRALADGPDRSVRSFPEQFCSRA